ncbi:hypothetical protein [Streptomyces sp. NPDC007100]|uniref:hypothetical protein n=1 Tax=Streptomyces sp. NPDC007100 TaxID=3155602 RepID=UPI0033DA7EAE
MRRIAIALVGITAAGFMAATPASATPADGWHKHLHKHASHHHAAAHYEGLNVGGSVAYYEADASWDAKHKDLDAHKYHYRHWVR